MKTLLYILGLTLSQSAFGQITYSPTFIDQCTGEPVERVFWSISDSTENYGNYFGTPTATLPKTGNYEMYCPSISEAPISITLSTYGAVKDTFLLRRLNSLVFIPSSTSDENSPNIPPKYFICDPDSLANGRVIDYYYNGNKREEGTFENGIRTDTLSIYYRTGELYKIVYPSGKGYKSTKYSIDGQIEE